MLNQEILEISVECDSEAAEAVSELFNRYNGGDYDEDSEAGEASGGGAVIESIGHDDFGRPIDGQFRMWVKTYIKPGERGESIRRQIEEGLWRLSLLYPIPEPQVRTLREEASRTPTREDDAIVARLEITAAERARLENALADAQAQAEGARRRLTELQGLRHDMRTRGVERSDWGFASGALVGALVGELLRGALSRDGFWDRMERQRMPGQMPGTSQPGPWGKPLPGPWGRPAPGPWSTGQAPSGDGWWDDDKSAYWGKGKPQGGGGTKGGGWTGGSGGGWSTGGGDSGGGFSTGGSSDAGGGFRTGGSV